MEKKAKKKNPTKKKKTTDEYINKWAKASKKRKKGKINRCEECFAACDHCN